jgi:hypothetical protein
VAAHLTLGVHDWRTFAACAAACRRGDADPSWWFPTRNDATSPGAGGSYARARAICTGCLVRRECLEECLIVEGCCSKNEVSGMFGGATPEERIRLARERRRLAAPAVPPASNGHRDPHAGSEDLIRSPSTR